MQLFRWSWSRPGDGRGAKLRAASRFQQQWPNGRKDEPQARGSFPTPRPAILASASGWRAPHRILLLGMKPEHQICSKQTLKQVVAKSKPERTFCTVATMKWEHLSDCEACRKTGRHSESRWEHIGTHFRSQCHWGALPTELRPRFANSDFRRHQELLQWRSWNYAGVGLTTHEGDLLRLRGKVWTAFLGSGFVRLFK